MGMGKKEVEREDRRGGEDKEGKMELGRQGAVDGNMGNGIEEDWEREECH